MTGCPHRGEVLGGTLFTMTFLNTFCRVAALILRGSLVVVPSLARGSPAPPEIKTSPDLVDTQIATSPDGRNRLETRMWNTELGCRIDIALDRDGRLVLTRSIPPQDDVRYVKLAWAPSSQTALVGLNQKSAEELLLIRIARGGITATLLNRRGFIDETMLDILPFRQEIASIAPVSFFSWRTIAWRNPRTCTLAYLTRGIGYEGTGQVLIDCSRARPRLKVLTVEPGVEPELWKQD